MKIREIINSGQAPLLHKICGWTEAVLILVAVDGKL